MELIWFEDYLALAESLNFSRAAEARHVTQPAFSRRIRALEGWVGADLFVRTTHGVALTTAGKQFHDQAEILTRAVHQLRRDTLEVAGRGNSGLTIAATHVLSFTFFPKWVRDNERLLALGNLNLISDSMQACEQMMLRGDAQFLLCHFHRQMSSRIETAQFKSIIVGTDTLVPLSAPDRNKRPRWRLRSDKPAKFLAYSAQSGLGRIIAARRAANDRRFTLDTVFTSHLAATLLSMTRAGDGVAWLPRTLAEEDIVAGLLVEAGDAELQIPIGIRLFRPVARQSQAAVRTYLRRQAEPLQFARRQCRRAAFRRQIAETEVEQHLETRRHVFEDPLHDQTFLGAGARIEHPQQIGQRGHASDRGPGGRRSALLLQRHRRRQPLDRIHLGHRHLVEKPPGIRRDRFQVATLSFRIERPEGEGRLSGSRDAGEHH
jgi:DNA-binding transcriptional LysR family regulator